LEHTLSQLVVVVLQTTAVATANLVGLLQLVAVMVGVMTMAVAVLPLAALVVVAVPRIQLVLLP
jgi:hypothetical protein